MRMHIGRRLKHTLLTGLFIIGPLSLTFMLLAWFVATVDRALAPVVGLIGRPIPGLGVATAVGIVLLAGVLASNIVGRHVLEFVEELLLRIPVFNWLYRTIKQLSEVFSPSAKPGFRSFVMIEYPRQGVYSFGFITRQATVDWGASQRTYCVVYIPTNHVYMGDYVLVPQEEIVYTSLTTQQGVQTAISAGASLPPVIRAQARPAPQSSAPADVPGVAAP